MRRLYRPASTGVGLFAAAMLWLWASNTADVASTTRSLLKTLPFVLASGGASLSTLSLVREHRAAWQVPLALHCAISGTTAFGLTVAGSRIAYPDALFHDEGGTSLVVRLTLLLGLSVATLAALSFVTAFLFTSRRRAG